MEKKFIWGGMFLGSTAGSYLPTLWGAEFFSLSSILLSALGGFLGIWIGWKIGRGL